MTPSASHALWMFGGALLGVVVALVSLVVTILLMEGRPFRFRGK